MGYDFGLRTRFKWKIRIPVINEQVGRRVSCIADLVNGKDSLIGDEPIYHEMGLVFIRYVLLPILRIAKVLILISLFNGP